MSADDSGCSARGSPALSEGACSCCVRVHVGGGMADSERGSSLQPRLDQIREQEQKLAELRSSKGPYDRAVRALTTNTREAYESLILENVLTSEPALRCTTAIEHQLWRLHHAFIKDFRARLEKLQAAPQAAANVHHKKKASEKQKFERVGGQYKCFLDEATGFYHSLIAKLGKLSSPSTIADVSSSNERFRKAECVAHRCYLYLGDLARYKEIHLVVEGRIADYYVAANYYRQASAMWPFGGNPHNQLGVLAMYAGDSLQALYHYLFSLAVPVPFLTARLNAKALFDMNQQHNSQLSNSPEEDLAIDIQMAQAFESHTTKSSTESHKECPLARLQRRFRVHFITLIGLIFNRAGLEELSGLSTPVLREAQLLLSQDTLITSSFTLEKSNPFKNQAFSVMQLVVLLILSIQNKERRSSRNPEGPEKSPFVLQAMIFALQFMTAIVQHCTRTEEPCCSHLFPAVVVFCNWLSSYPDLVQQIQGDEECDKFLCSFGKEASVLLAKCLQQVSTTKKHDYDCIALSEREGLHGIETVLWEDKELYGIVALKYLETAMKTSALAKTTPDSACVVRVERLMKALTFLSSVFKLDSSELDVIGSVTKSSFGWASLRASSSEGIKCTQSSGGSVRTGDGSMELKTQEPCIVLRSFEISLLSHCRKEDRIFLKARDRKLDPVGPSKLSKPPSEVPCQLNTITGGELRASNVSEGTTCRQPESELHDNRLETILEEPARNQSEHRDEGAFSSVGRGALSLGDWVRASEDNVDATPVLKKRKNMSRLSQTHSSGEESLNPSLSFKAPKPPRAPSCSNEAREKEQQTDSPGFRKSTDTRQGSAQDPIDLDEEATEPREVKSGLSSSQSRKRKHSPEVAVPPSEEDVEVPPSEEDVETGKQTPFPTNTEEAHAVDGQTINTTDAQSVQIPSDQEQEEHHNVIVDGADPPQPMDTPRQGLEGCSAVAGRGKKRKPEAVTPTTLCYNCQGTSPGEGDSERLNVVSGCSKYRRASKRPRVKESMESDEDYSWLDTYTHVVPQALTKLAAAMSKASFSFSDFGIFFELGAI